MEPIDRPVDGAPPAVHIALNPGHYFLLYPGESEMSSSAVGVVRGAALGAAAASGGGGGGAAAAPPAAAAPVGFLAHAAGLR